jgi:hypothetical protein
LSSKETTWAPNSGLAGLIFFTYFTHMGFFSCHFISQNVSGCSVVRLFEFLKNCWFWFFNYSRIKRTTGSSYFKNLTEPVGFMKEPGKNCWFFDFFIFFENCVMYQNQFFEFFENWWVSACIPGLITGGYLPLIPGTTNRHVSAFLEQWIRRRCVLMWGFRYAGNV